MYWLSRTLVFKLFWIRDRPLIYDVVRGRTVGNAKFQLAISNQIWWKIKKLKPGSNVWSIGVWRNSWKNLSRWDDDDARADDDAKRPVVADMGFKYGVAPWSGIFHSMSLSALMLFTMIRGPNYDLLVTTADFFSDLRGKARIPSPTHATGTQVSMARAKCLIQVGVDGARFVGEAKSARRVPSIKGEAKDE